MLVYLPSAIVAALIAVLASTQSIASEVKTWTQTSVEDFRKGMLHNVVIASTFGGELGLPHPMKKVVADYQDNAVPRFVSQDSEGRYAQAWKEADGVYAQRYDTGGEPLGERFRASNITLDESDAKIDYSSPSREACTTSHPNGEFLIAWDCAAYKSHQLLPHPYRIYGQFYDSDGKPLGGSFRIDEGIGGSSYYPTAFVDKKGIFWAVWSEQVSTSAPERQICLYAQRYAIDGQRVGGNFRLIEEGVSNSQLFAAAALAPNGDLAVAWRGDDRKLLIQWFDSGGKISGHAIKLNASDQVIPFLQELGRLDLCFDGQGNLLAVWELGVYPPPPSEMVTPASTVSVSEGDCRIESHLPSRREFLVRPARTSPWVRVGCFKYPGWTMRQEVLVSTGGNGRL